MAASIPEAVWRKMRMEPVRFVVSAVLPRWDKHPLHCHTLQEAEFAAGHMSLNAACAEIHDVSTVLAGVLVATFKNGERVLAAAVTP